MDLRPLNVLDRWPLRSQWLTPDGHVLAIAGAADELVLAEDPGANRGRKNPHLYRTAVAATWQALR